MSASSDWLSLPRPILFTYVLSILYNVTFFMQFVTMPYLIKGLGISDSSNGKSDSLVVSGSSRSTANDIWSDSSCRRSSFRIRHSEVWSEICPVSLLWKHPRLWTLALFCTGWWVEKVSYGSGLQLDPGQSDNGPLYARSAGTSDSFVGSD